MIRTVLGDISPDSLGVCYAHEHIIIDASYTTDKNPEFLLDDVDAATRELSEFHAHGGRAMIDSMPCDCGRNVLKLAEISHRSGVHIVCPTGLHLMKYYDPGHWGNFYSEDELATLFITEINEGMDAAHRSYWKHHGGAPGMNFLLTTFAEAMKNAGLTDHDPHRIFVTNPSQAYQFKQATTP